MRWWVVFMGCLACRPEAELVTYDCPGDGCPTCATDDVCVVVHNPCHERATCVHRDVNLAVTQEGCSKALERETPPDEACVCVQEACTAL